MSSQPDQQTTQSLIDLASFVFDRWEFLVGLLLGGGTVKTVNRFVTEKKNKSSISQKGGRDQAASVIDSPETSVQQARRDVVNLGHYGISLSTGDLENPTFNLQQIPESSVTVVQLTPRQEFIHRKLVELSKQTDQAENFSTRYKNGIRLINEHHAQLAASDYFAACLLVQDKLFDRGSYRDGVNKAAQATLQEAVRNLEVFLTDGTENHSQLSGIIDAFEDSMVKLNPHLL